MPICFLLSMKKEIGDEDDAMESNMVRGTDGVKEPKLRFGTGVPGLRTLEEFSS